jgi:hypothetical protein
MLKRAFVELDPDMDCIGSVTAFEYVILKGWIEAIEMGAALLTGARDRPPTTVDAGVGVGGLQWLKKMSQCLHDFERSNWCELMT